MVEVKKTYAMFVLSLCRQRQLQLKPQRQGGVSKAANAEKRNNNTSGCAKAAIENERHTVSGNCGTVVDNGEGYYANHAG